MSHFSYLAPDTNSSEQIRPKKWSSWVTQSPPLNLSVMLLEKFWDAHGEKKWKQKLIQKGANLQRYGSFPGWKPKRKYDRGETFVSLRGCMIRLLKTRHTGNWRKFSHLAWDFWVQWWWINPIVVVWGLSCHNHYTRPWFCGFGGDRQQCLYKQWQMCRAFILQIFASWYFFTCVCDINVFVRLCEFEQGHIIVAIFTKSLTRKLHKRYSDIFSENCPLFVWKWFEKWWPKIT